MENGRIYLDLIHHFEYMLKDFLMYNWFVLTVHPDSIVFRCILYPVFAPFCD